MNHLDGCRERVRRAIAHFEALYAERQSWEGTSHEYITEHDPDSGWHIFRTKYFQPPPLILGVLASDYVHQLRATLDNLVCLLAEFNGTSCTKDHAFPVVKKSGEWKGAVNGRLKGLRSDHIVEIETAQPYTAGYDPDDHPFAVLDELSRLDKFIERPVFPARAFTTCWRSDLSQIGIEVAFGRDRNLQSLGGPLLALSLHPQIRLPGAARSLGRDWRNSQRESPSGFGGVGGSWIPPFRVGATPPRR